MGAFFYLGPLATPTFASSIEPALYVCTVYICVCVRYCLYIWTRWVVEIMKIWQLILIVSIVKILVQNQINYWFFLFILIILVGLHNTYILNYTRIFFKKNCIPNTRKHSQGHFQVRYQTLKNEIVFQKILSEKWTIFSKNVNVETNRALFFKGSCIIGVLRLLLINHFRKTLREKLTNVLRVLV